MTVYDVIDFFGALAMFLFGMNYMSSALEKKAGGKLSWLLSKFTSNKYKGFLLGAVVTVAIQSSSVTTVMVVGFINSGIMALSQAVGVIIGANVGTTITAWVLSLSALEGNSLILNLLKPSTFAPILAVFGIILYMFQKSSEKRDVGMIFLGFSILMFGMQTISDSVEGLSNVTEFTNLFVMFENPLLGLLAGTLLTAVIQSSSACVGILQALSVTGRVSVAAAFPIILGQNIGTCITTVISSFGANKNAKRAAVIHLNFNFLGSIILMILFYGLNRAFNFSFFDKSVNSFSIALIHTVCNLICTAVFLPFSSVLENLSIKLIKEKNNNVKEALLDERLFVNLPSAIFQSRKRVVEMANEAVVAISEAMRLLLCYDENKFEKIINIERKADEYEDAVSSYLIKLSSKKLAYSDNIEITKLIYVTSYFESISDRAVNIAFCARELYERKYKFSENAKKELSVIIDALFEMLGIIKSSLRKNEWSIFISTQALEQVVDKLTSKAKRNHIERMKNGKCTFEMGVIYCDILSAAERVSKNCSQIAASINELSHNSMGMYKHFEEYKNRDNEEFVREYERYKKKYSFN